MDPHYLRLRRRRRLLRAAAVCAFFGLLSLPLLYLLRSEVRGAAATAYQYAQREFMPPSVEEAKADLPTPPTAAPQPPPPAAPPAVAQAKPSAPAAPAPRRHTAKLGDVTFRIPEGYVEGKADLGSKRDPTILLRALLPDLRPRAEGRGACAPKKVACSDFAIIKLRPAGVSLESEFTKRYRIAPSGMALIPGIHGLRQIPPHKAQPADGLQFLAQPAGRWVWITCREFGRPQAKRPALGICQLAFDTGDGLAIRVRFDRSKLQNWSEIHAKAIKLVASLRG